MSGDMWSDNWNEKSTTLQLTTRKATKRYCRLLCHLLLDMFVFLSLPSFNLWPCHGCCSTCSTVNVRGPLSINLYNLSEQDSVDLEPGTDDEASALHSHNSRLACGQLECGHLQGRGGRGEARHGQEWHLILQTLNEGTRFNKGTKILL